MLRLRFPEDKKSIEFNLYDDVINKFISGDLDDTDNLSPKQFEKNSITILKLVCLYDRSCYLQENLGQLKKFSRLLPKYQTINTLDLSNIAFGYCGINILYGVLLSHPTITKINLRNTSLAFSDNLLAENLAEILKCNPLRNLDISDNYIQHQDMETLGPVLMEHKTLSALNLSMHGDNVKGRDRFDNDSLKIISQIILRNKTLKTLKIGSMISGAEGLEILSTAFTQNKTITNFNIRGSKIGVRGCEILKWILGYNKTLTRLDLSDNNIQTPGLLILASVLNQLSSLVLDGNQIGDPGCTILKQTLKPDGNLTRLDLSNNGIGPDGMRELIPVLTHLKSLKISKNSIGDSGCEILSTFLEKNHTMTRLDLIDNKLSLDDGYERLIKCLVSNKTLIDFNPGSSGSNLDPMFYELISNNIKFSNEKNLALFNLCFDCYFHFTGLSEWLLRDIFKIVTDYLSISIHIKYLAIFGDMLDQHAGISPAINTHDSKACELKLSSFKQLSKAHQYKLLSFMDNRAHCDSSGQNSQTENPYSMFFGPFKRVFQLLTKDIKDTTGLSFF
jgi:Ran GTPase-activating protein (RanGAP) involved in mRNA processing and transport